MKTKHSPAFKQSQLFDWHTEPKEDHGSSFFQETTFGSTLSGYERRPAPKRGLNPVLVAIVLAVVFGIAGLVGIARFLHH
jgi:hypothetical protein